VVRRSSNNGAESDEELESGANGEYHGVKGVNISVGIKRLSVKDVW
jgi:hypothetical protein